ncbi:MAG TPA: metallophosphoesterase [Usitatibacter sp.]|nr:metallophosphoesterase [Usitatibacter sp.]
MMRWLRAGPFPVFLLLLHVYIGLRLLAPLPVAGQLAGALLLATCFTLLPRGWRIPETGRVWKDLLPWTAMGFFSWLFVLTLLRDAGLLAAWPFLGDAAFARAVRDSALAVLAAAPLVTAAGFHLARRVAPVVDVRVPIQGLPAALDGFTIAQISDVHVGPTIRRDFVEAVVQRVNAMGADLVAITGDLVDGPVDKLAPHTEPLSRLRSRHGTYFVTGNHEYYSGVHAWIQELHRLGARVLMNEHVVLQHDGAAVALAGVTDYAAHHFDRSHRSDPLRASEGAPAHAVKVLLAHQPRSAAEAVRAGFDLQLSGHTHGGQFWPWVHFVRLQQPFTAGLRRLGHMWIYVSRGTGYWGPPMRFGSPSEITRLRLVPG